MLLVKLSGLVECTYLKQCFWKLIHCSYRKWLRGKKQIVEKAKESKAAWKYLAHQGGLWKHVSVSIRTVKGKNDQRLRLMSFLNHIDQKIWKEQWDNQVWRGLPQKADYKNKKKSLIKPKGFSTFIKQICYVIIGFIDRKSQHDRLLLFSIRVQNLKNSYTFYRKS
jgi:hypothetical protein